MSFKNIKCKLDSKVDLGMKMTSAVNAPGLPNNFNNQIHRFIGTFHGYTFSLTLFGVE